MEDKKLTAKQERFIQEYLISLNATDAAIKSGYSEKTAYAIGNENLSKPIIKAAIALSQAKTEETLLITKESLIEDLIAIKELNRFSERTSHVAIKAIEVINKMQGYNAVEKKEVEHKGGIIWNEEKSYSNEI
jgi:phage terminase small subunit